VMDTAATELMWDAILASSPDEPTATYTTLRAVSIRAGVATHRPAHDIPHVVGSYRPVALEIILLFDKRIFASVLHRGRLRWCQAPIGHERTDVPAYVGLHLLDQLSIVLRFGLHSRILPGTRPRGAGKEHRDGGGRECA